MTVTIRRATHDDVEALLGLRHQVAGEGVWIGAELLASLEDGTIVGHLSIHQRIGIADLGMNVASGHRGAGIGAALLGSAIDWARPLGCHKIQLEHWPWNKRARRLYERFGFVEEGYRRRHYRRNDGSLWDAVLMGLVLDDRAPGHDPRATEPPRPPG